MFWALILFIPFAFLVALLTKHFDDGEGMTFQSDNVVVIIFAHIGEEVLGLFLTPIWFIKALITKDFEGAWKVIDFITYFIEIVIIVICSLLL